MPDDTDPGLSDPSATAEEGETPYLLTETKTSTDTATEDMYEEKAMLLIEQLIERGVFQMDEDNPVLYHEPSGYRFASAVNAAHFHNGWTAANGQVTPD